MSGSLWYLLGLLALIPIAGIVWWKLSAEWKASCWLPENVAFAAFLAYSLYVAAPAVIWVLPLVADEKDLLIAGGILIACGMGLSPMGGRHYAEKRAEKLKQQTPQ